MRPCQHACVLIGDLGSAGHRPGSHRSEAGRWPSPADFSSCRQLGPTGELDLLLRVVPVGMGAEHAVLGCPCWMVGPERAAGGRQGDRDRHHPGGVRPRHPRTMPRSTMLSAELGVDDAASAAPGRRSFGRVERGSRPVNSTGLRRVNSILGVHVPHRVPRSDPVSDAAGGRSREPRRPEGVG